MMHFRQLNRDTNFHRLLTKQYFQGSLKSRNVTYLCPNTNPSLYTYKNYFFIFLPGVRVVAS